MANYFLKPVYKKIFDSDFRSSCFEDRMQMQKSIYLLQEMGISLGNYDFKWYKHGPYSQGLQNDILKLSGIDSVPIKYSTDAKIAIDALKCSIFQEGLDYSTCQWAECLGSLHYIKDNILPSSATDDDVLKELKILKPHLNNYEDNKRAMQVINELFA